VDLVENSGKIGRKIESKNYPLILH